MLVTHTHTQTPNLDIALKGFQGQDLSAKDRDWVCEAVEAINADFLRSADTHLHRLVLPGLPGITFYLKDESTHPTGSLKHRLARSLFLYGLCNGHIRRGTPVIEASSGSTAISEAYFAQLLGLPFISVIPEGTQPCKLDQVRFYGGDCHSVPSGALYDEAQALADKMGGHYMDQFTYAERATDWRGNNNIAESLFAQMTHEPHPAPNWVVTGAGTGGTSATLGRYIRYNPHLYGQTRLCVADPDNSAFYPFFKTGDRAIRIDKKSRIEGIGRPRVEPSFIPTVVDAMIHVPDAASVATVRWLERILGRKCGGSTGTNVYAALQLALDMKAKGQSGSIATLICDSGERYRTTYFDDGWAKDEGLDLRPHLETLYTLTPHLSETP
ncbi:PLP-dependent cysteine synthase family protein [Woodsholea maritima]|uniref:PLP-dependent cysteine synthase family protein n=1 Tax=Woodsholea maritima TaxID=240237 RepID=UPI00037A0E2E|nr:pyridoxal-phosphate dependent enzyme [Woodsholea maritima]